jgi:hypothetical protein
MKKAGICVRVSTADQHVESQLYDLRELASRRSFEVVKVYQDCGVSGRRARRPGLDALMADARQHKFEMAILEPLLIETDGVSAYYCHRAAPNHPRRRNRCRARSCSSDRCYSGRRMGELGLVNG